jgi:ComF family protein
MEENSPPNRHHSKITQPARPGSIDVVCAAYSYQFPTSNLVWRFKYQQDIRLATQFALDISRLVLQKELQLPDKLVPVPIHTKRLVQRGFNQSALIAEQLGKELGISVDNKLVSRTRNTLPQHTLSGTLKQKNVYGAFRCKGVSGCESVAIIDDVVTTGSTANEIARELKKTGGKKVFLWAWVSAQ